MKNYLQSFNLFSEDDIVEVLALGRHETIKKGEFFFQGGRVCNKVAFVFDGIFRHFYQENAGDEITYCFTFPNNFITAYTSFVSNKSTHEQIQALSDGTLFVIPKKEMDELINTRKNWMEFSKKIADRQYMKRENRIFLLQKESAKIKYEHLMQHKPEYLQSIPLQYLASYIGVTQRHLSRLRKEVSF